MRKICKLLFCVICFPCIVYSQQWHAYSDSIISNINKNDFDKAINFQKLAESEISKTKIIRDTLYADYLYSNGVVNYFLEKKSIDFLNESLNIWDRSVKKNQFKIMKIHYFLGKSYYLLYETSKDKLILDKSYEAHEKCYLINIQNNIPKSTIFSKNLYALAFLGSKIGKDLLKVKKYTNEYIELNRKSGIKKFDFTLITSYLFINDIAGQEITLKEYLARYEQEKINDPELLYNIYVGLYDNCVSQRDNSNNLINYRGVIKYGEKAIDLLQSNNLKVDNKLSLIFAFIKVAYLQMSDNINFDKYEELEEKYFPKKSINKYDELTNLIENEDYTNFKNKFEDYEIELKSHKDYKGLSDIYGLALYSHELNQIFSEEVVLEKLNFIILHQSELTTKEQIAFEQTLVNFYFTTGTNLKEALRICTKNLETENMNLNLYFYSYKSNIEAKLGDPEAIKTAYKALSIAIDVYGEDNPRVLTYYIHILVLDVIGKDLNTTKIGSKALKIIYDNKLEETNIAAQLFLRLGIEAKSKANYLDYFRYINKSKLILEKNGNDSHFGLYMVCLLELSEISIKLEDYELATTYLEFVKKYLDEISFGDSETESGYYWHLGDLNFFQNKYKEAKDNYEKALSKGENILQLQFKLIICDYLIERNNIKTIASLENFDKKNYTDLGTYYIYLLKYNIGDFKRARTLLIDLLKKIKVENSQYFHLLSDYEKERIYKSFSIQFEFLNTYLLDSDPIFLNQYINFRFYSKSLLFSNSFKANYEVEKNKELYSELQNNIVQINKNIEIKIEDTENTDKLKYRNREIEKLLSIDTKPLYVPAIDDLYNKLKLDDAYVEIIRINKQSRNAIIAPNIEKVFTDSISYGAIVIKKNSSPKFILIDGSNQLEKQYTTSFKSKIQTKQEDLESYHLLFEKIDNELKDVKNIYLVTDGVYNSINIESIYNPNKKQYLIDYLKIQPIQNVRAITDEKREFKAGSNTKTILFGNPDFDLLITDANTDNFSLDRGLDNLLLDEIKSGVKIGLLNGTQKEIETLDAILRESKSAVTMFSKNTATEDNLKNVQSPDILHIATHGYFLKNDDTSKTKQSISNLVNDNYKKDSYLKSGLLLAGAQNTLNGKHPENSNNGILTAEEAKSLNLKDTELVVLSACETGLGDNLVGEGVIGLQRAFMIAGAKSVIMSLWSVSDEKTQELMTLFYTNWIKNNMSKEEALYQAKLTMKKLYPEPYYWAGFVLLE